MVVKFNLIDQVIRKRMAGGIDWGANIIVLVRFGKKELWWRPGNSFRSGRGQCYSSSRLEIVEDGERQHRDYRGHTMTLSEGGRLSRKLLDQHADTINKFFGVKLAHIIDKKKTLVDDPAEKPVQPA